MLRRVFERLSRKRVLKRRLPSDFGSRPIYVSPDAALRFWRYDLKWNADRRSFEHPRLSLNNPLSSREFSTQLRIEKFEESYGRTSQGFVIIHERSPQRSLSTVVGLKCRMGLP